MSRFGIDCRFAAKPAGLGRFTRELLRELVPLLKDHDLTFFVRSKNEDWLKSFSNVTLVEADIGNYSLKEQTAFPRLIQKANIDLFYSPHFNVPLSLGIPFVVTIHDLILHRYPNDSSLIRHIAYQIQMRHTVAKAKAILAVSEFTKKELLELYGSDLASKLSVSGEGVSREFFRRGPEEYERLLQKHQIHTPYFLYVGNSKQHKNVQMLIDAFAASGLTGHELILVTHGKESERLRLANSVKILGDIPDGELPALYTAARASVTASLYEGYYLPAVEAAACGCPVIATNVTAIPEVAPQGSLLVDPTLEALKKAFQSPPPKLSSIPSLPQWKDAARKTADVLIGALSVSPDRS